MSNIFHRLASLGLLSATIALLLNTSATAQGDTNLDNAARLMALAALNPDKLIEIHLMTTSSLSQREFYRTKAAPCFQAISNSYQANLPELQRQLAIMENNMPHHDAKGTAAYEAFINATAYIRAANIVELTITAPDLLQSNQDFIFNRNIHDQLVMTLTKWSQMPNNAAASVAQSIETMFQQLIPIYKRYKLAMFRNDANFFKRKYGQRRNMEISMASYVHCIISWHVIGFAGRTVLPNRARIV